MCYHQCYECPDDAATVYTRCVTDPCNHPVFVERCNNWGRTFSCSHDQFDIYVHYECIWIVCIT
eukprot:UN09335